MSTRHWTAKALLVFQTQANLPSEVDVRTLSDAVTVSGVLVPPVEAAEQGTPVFEIAVTSFIALTGPSASAGLKVTGTAEPASLSAVLLTGRSNPVKANRTS